jgi:hypothetical protein
MVKALCVKIINPVTREEVLEHPGVRLHEEYPVLSIVVEPGRGAKFRILTSDSTPALFDAAMFATTNGRLPPNWVVRASENGIVEFGPAAWLERGFWEHYFDRDPAAVATFDAEKREAIGSAQE